MPEQYQYREGYRGPRKAPINAIAAELERLRATGDLTATRLFEAAVPEDAPAHPEFEWDHDKAFHEYNLIRARQLIRAVIVVTKASEDARSVYVRVPERDQREGRYVPLSEIVQNIDEYERALLEAQRYLDVAERRFHELRRLAEGQGKAEALAIAIQGFSTIKEALALLRG